MEVSSVARMEPTVLGPDSECACCLDQSQVS